MRKHLLICLLLFLLFPVSLFAAGISFDQLNRRVATVGLQPVAVAIGDLDADGKPDLAVANASSNTVSILKSNGDATFLVAVNYDVGIGPSFVAIGDFNSDSHPDLAVVNWYGNTVSILLGNGDGTFQTAVNVAVGSHPRSVAIADFNSDGTPDLAVANESSFDVSILRGNGDGTFQAAVSYGMGDFNSPISVAIADLDGDSQHDLVVANLNYDYPNVSVLRGNGDGTFQAVVVVAVGIRPRSVVVGDFNADGRSDLAVANESPLATQAVSVLLGNGDFSFQPAVN